MDMGDGLMIISGLTMLLATLISDIYDLFNGPYVFTTWTQLLGYNLVGFIGLLVLYDQVGRMDKH